MHNKKGFQLSINMLVVIIISLVLFGAGLMIFNNIVDVAFKMEEDMTAQTETKLDNMMNDGSLVVALRTTVTESQGKTATFPIGFWNNKGEAQFEIRADNGPNVPDTKFVVNPSPNDHDEKKWEAYFLQPPSLGTNEDFKTLLNIYVPVDAEKGQYAFDISILNAGNLHGQKQRVYVIVP